MPQIAYIDDPPTQTHLVVGLPAPATLCGHLVLKWAENLPFAEQSWPDPEAPWCQTCRKAYSGE